MSFADVPYMMGRYDEVTKVVRSIFVYVHDQQFHTSYRVIERKKEVYRLDIDKPIECHEQDG